MSEEKTKNSGFLQWRTLRTVMSSLLVMGFLSACSSVPDAINPVEWYRDASDLITGDDSPQSGAQTAVDESDASVPGEHDAFPTLASVPERPSVYTGEEVADSLIADPNKPAYAAAPARQTEDGDIAPPPAPIPESAPVADSNLQPAPPAQPALPVTSEPTAATMVTANAPAAATPTLVKPTANVVSSMPLVVEPGRLPSGETYEEYRARLMAGLETPGMTAMTTPTTQPARTQPARGNGSDTVVISSTGIDMTTPYTSGSGAVTTLINQAGFQQIGMQVGQPLLTAGSTKIATIHFGSGSSRLDVNDLQVLQKVAALQKQKGGTIRVIGHASSRTRSMDPVRHKMVNYKVSVARADSIARQLVRLGTSKTSVLVGAASDTQPKFFEVMPTGEAGNRRAEIYIDS